MLCLAYLNLLSPSCPNVRAPVSHISEYKASGQEQKDQLMVMRGAPTKSRGLLQRFTWEAAALRLAVHEALANWESQFAMLESGRSAV